MPPSTGLLASPCISTSLHEARKLARVGRRSHRGVRGPGWECHVAAENYGSRVGGVPMQAGVDPDQEESYYTILGVSPAATSKEIKKAYYDTMRDYHPDISTDEDATDFCIFLNEIYETLSDPVSRLAYDEISGFDEEAVNPFEDTSFPEDKVFVDEFTCIGCRNCCNVCPSSFGIEELHGRARVSNQGMDTEDMLQEAIDTCPVSCIHWVSSPQLTLLENQMAKIELKSAYLLLMGCGGSRDVFQEAYTAFEKRQAAIRAKKEQDNMRSWMDEAGIDVEWKKADPGDVKRRAAAAKAAASARRWRDYQRRQRDRDAMYLAAGE